MKILYGTINHNIDITEICLKKLLNNNIITIPSRESTRTSIFIDPLFGVLKKILILINDRLTQYEYFYTIKINIIDNTIKVINDNEINDKTLNIQQQLKINYGNFNEELPEQRMVVRYLTGNEKVLEIGGNIGRNSLIIGHILNQNNNNDFVTLETDEYVVEQLRQNRDLNNLKFNIENSALSNRKLIQSGINTIQSDVILEGYKSVKTITLDQLYLKYNIKFDTLILDCEGAFYYILIDIPELLENVNLIIMENDYWDITQKNYVDSILIKNNFYRDYVETGGWGPCYNIFYEVWKKSI
jgi:FkbM family methyltransferase